MEELQAWADAERGRHFVVKMGNTYIETQWRVVVWSKKEGEVIEGRPGEGYGETLDEAVEEALKNWRDQAWLQRKTGINWYVPVNVADRIGSKP